jgi:hypothetical protein
MTETAVGPQDERPGVVEAIAEVMDIMFNGNNAFGEVMEAHLIERPDFTEALQDVIPFLLNRFGPVHSVPIAIGIGLLAGQRMELPKSHIPDQLPEDFK